MPDTKKIAIIGAGLAGLAAAVRLKAKGHEVHVFEKNEKHGGKLDEFEQNGFRFDKGPSLLTEPWLIDELFTLFGKNPKDYFQYERQPESCRYFYPDNSSFTVFGNDQKDKEVISANFNAEEAEQFLNYKHSSKKVFERTGKLFIDEAQPKLIDFLKWKFIRRYPEFFSKRFRKNLHDFNADQFKDKKLIQLFDRYGTYNGSDPYRMNGLYSMIPHLEMNLGTYFPVKGMRSIPDSIFTLALENDVRFHFNTPVSISIDGSNKYLIQDQLFDQVVCAIDHLTFYRDVLRDNSLFQKYSKQERSTSGLVFFMGIDTEIKEFGLHNLLFSSNYEKEFEELTRRHQLIEDPSIYIHISSRAIHSDSISGGQNLFIMVNTPPGVHVDERYRNHVKGLLFERVRKISGISIEEHIVHESHWDTQTIEALTGSYQGALYGPSSNSIMATFKRHPNKSDKYPNLFFCGGTAHPGGGIPLVLRSSKIVSELIA